jgi:hypothetical protein
MISEFNSGKILKAEEQLRLSVSGSAPSYEEKYGVASEDLNFPASVSFPWTYTHTHPFSDSE